MHKYITILVVCQVFFLEFSIPQIFTLQTVFFAVSTNPGTFAEALELMKRKFNLS